MLRTIPNVGRIFVMIKGNDNDAILRRLKNEIIDEELFKHLKQIHGKSYEAFMMSKLLPIRGDVCEDNLGMDAHTATQVAEQVHVIVNSAAVTTFYKRNDVALNTNTKGPARLLDFAKKCKNLKLFLHVSTAYVSGERKGIILEKPLFIGQSTLLEESINSSSVSVPLLDVSAEMKLISGMMESLSLGNDIEAVRKLKHLGVERSRIYGWQDTYAFTKAMGEMLINSQRENLPVVIIRPSIIESTYTQPFPGWIQGNRALEPLFISYGKGRFQGFAGNPKTILDIIPVDMVVNAIIAAMARHGTVSKAQLDVYHVTSSVSNPISFRHLFDLAYDHFTSFPLLNSKGVKIGIKEFKFFSSVDSFSSYIRDETERQILLEEDNISTLDPKLLLQMQTKGANRVKQFLHLAKTYEPYAFFAGRFDNSNTKKLIKGMSAKEMNAFGFDAQRINWKHYIKHVHLPGIRKHIIKEKPMTAAIL